MGQAYYKWGKRDGLEVYFLGRSNMTCCVKLATVARIKGKGKEDDSCFWLSSAISWEGPWEDRIGIVTSGLLFQASKSKYLAQSLVHKR